MLRLFVYFVGILGAAFGLSWLADRPGSLVINWQGYEIETSVFRAIVMLALTVALSVLGWSVIKQVFSGPTFVSQFFKGRRQRRGLDALTSGLIAVGAGDKMLATRFAAQARKSLPNEPLTQLLRAQTAELIGDRATSMRIYESMRNNPETELLGLRGLYLEATNQGKAEAARLLAERAVAINPKLSWPVESLFAVQCRKGDWSNALVTLGEARKNGTIDKKDTDSRRAALLTAQAMEVEETDTARALALALEANRLVPALVPAAAIAGRLLASQGATAKAARILKKAWKASPHPDLALAYAYARIGDSPRDRLQRVRDLAKLAPHDNEGQLAVAAAAIEAQDWAMARRALYHLVTDRPSQRVCTLMARIEGGEHGNTGKVREWLARAVHAPRDPVWIADGHISNRWQPVSPVTGELGTYAWKLPTGDEHSGDSELLLEQLSAKMGQGHDGLAVTGLAPGGTTDEANTIDGEVTVPLAKTSAPKSKEAHQERPAHQSAPQARPPLQETHAENDTPPVQTMPPVARRTTPAAQSSTTTVATATRSSTGANGSDAPHDQATAISAIAPAETKKTQLQLPPTTATGASTSVAAKDRPSGSNATPEPKTASRADITMMPAKEQPTPARDKAVATTGGKPNTAGMAAPHGGSSTVTSVPAMAGASDQARRSAPAGPKSSPETPKAKPKVAREQQRDQKIFVPPRAPDDPGPEESEIGEGRAPLTRFRMPQSKGSG